LFSKWFSESGKLVTKLFDHIRDMVDDEDALVCVLIDEVESLTAARSGAASGMVVVLLFVSSFSASVI
jgi:SpoVK/Ycf46/Vps4 family AAA+-type ATPase